MAASISSNEETQRTKICKATFPIDHFWLRFFSLSLILSEKISQKISYNLLFLKTMVLKTSTRLSFFPLILKKFLNDYQHNLCKGKKVNFKKSRSSR